MIDLLLTIFVLLSTGATFGFYQGMVMIMKGDAMHNEGMINGIRGHKWFQAAHRSWMLVVLMSALAGNRLYITPITTVNVLSILGAAVLGWELLEVCYSFARYAVLLPEHEHVFGYRNFYVKGKTLVSLHIARLVTGGVLLSILFFERF